MVVAAAPAAVAPAGRFDYPAFSRGPFVEISDAFAASPYVRGAGDDWLDAYDAWGGCAPCCDLHCALCVSTVGGDAARGALAWSSAASEGVPLYSSPAWCEPRAPSPPPRQRARQRAPARERKRDGWCSAPSRARRPISL